MRCSLTLHTSFSSPQWFHVSPSVYTHRSVCFLGPRLACHCSSCRWMAPPRQWEQTFLITKPTPTHLPQCQLSQNPTTEKHREAINCNGQTPNDCYNCYKNAIFKTVMSELNTQRRAWIGNLLMIWTWWNKKSNLEIRNPFRTNPHFPGWCAVTAVEYPLPWGLVATLENYFCPSRDYIYTNIMCIFSHATSLLHKNKMMKDFHPNLLAWKAVIWKVVIEKQCIKILLVLV